MYDFIESHFPLQYRVVVGCTIFFILGYLDWRKKGWESQRVKEYLFLLFAGVTGLLYGAVHDLITVSISPEYFTLGKGLPDDSLVLRASWLGAKASFGPSMIIAAGFAVLNNPIKQRPQIKYSKLARFLSWPLSIAIGFAIIFGFLGHIDILSYSSQLPTEITHPVEFLTVWGIHWGSYTGGAIGAIVGAFRIWNFRRLSK